MKENEEAKDILDRMFGKDKNYVLGILKLLTILVVIGVTCLLLDLYRISNNKEPLMSIPIYGLMNGDIEYIGLGYKINGYSNSKVTGEKYKIVSWFTKIDNPNNKGVSGVVVEITDELYIIENSKGKYYIRKNKYIIHDREIKVGDEVY